MRRMRADVEGAEMDGAEGVTLAQQKLHDEEGAEQEETWARPTARPRRDGRSPCGGRRRGM